MNTAISDAIDRAMPKGGGKPPQTPNEVVLGLPAHCSVRAVGKMGTTCIFLDALHQLTFADPRQLGEAYLTDYFAGDVEYLVETWPRHGKEKITFSAEDCRRAIQYECSVKGIWSDMERVRGRGAWRADGDDPGLVLHCGDVIYFPSGARDPGEHDGRVYPGGPAMMRPLSKADKIPKAGAPDAAAHRIYELLKSWNWKRPCLDARLYLGLMVGGFAGGALDWRPSGWITGESRTGKSTLIRLRREIMDTFSLNASNATAASIYQKVRFDAVAVTLDEQENSSDSRRLDDMVKLARDAASGDLILRGGSGGSGFAFQARNSFQFASINAAALRQQDLNRMPQLELHQLGKDAKEPEWTPLEARMWGREILRRLIDHWHRWEETYQLHRSALKRMGHDSRGADTFGTLLALADLVLSEGGYLSDNVVDADPDYEEVWGQMSPALLSEYTEAIPNWQACLEHLLASRPREWKTGAPASIGGACRNFLAGVLFEKPDGGVGVRTEHVAQDLNEVNALLAYAGCRVFRDGKTGFSLFISNNHPGLLAIYEMTDWKGIPGAPGPWNKAMGNAPEGRVEAKKLSVDGTQARGKSVKLEDFIDWSAGGTGGGDDDQP